MPDYEALEALADIGAGVVQPDRTEDLRSPRKEEPVTYPAKNRVTGNHNQILNSKEKNQL